MKGEIRPIDGITELKKSIVNLGYKHSIWQVFEDFVTLSACSVSNSVDFLHREEREKIYLDTIKKYTKKEAEEFPKMFALLVEALEQELSVRGPSDVLGRLYHDLELHNKWRGQFFTPQSIADMMAEMSISDHDADIGRRGYITVCEPCCGSGVMILGMAKALLKSQYSPSQNLVVTAADLDLKCACMAYIQLSLYGIPAVIEHADTLTCKVFSRWYTPVYLLDGWLFRQHCGITDQDGLTEDEKLKCGLDPVYAAFRFLDNLKQEKKEPASVPSPAAADSIKTSENKNGQLSLF